MADALPSDVNPVVAAAAPRVRLVVHAGSEAGTGIACRRVVTLLGSRDGCKVTLRDRRVSPVHTAIVNDGVHVLAVDLVTKKGTLLNGLKMEHERLNDGDVLTIKPWEFRVEVQEAVQSGDADLHPFALEPTPRMVVLEHLDTGRVLQPHRDLCVIGRRNGCDIVISDHRVSRVHALLLSYFGHPAIFDLLSQNHTLVNDVPVPFHLLENDDVITIGDSRFRARLVGSSVTERASANKFAVETTVALTPEERSSDLVDIQATEGAQAWRIAENLQEATGER